MEEGSNPEIKRPSISTPRPDYYLRRPATNEEIDSLPHVIDHIPFRAWVVILAASAERFTYFGIMAPWQNYMQNPSDNYVVPGALGLGQSTATDISNAFLSISFLTPLLFGFISDMWLGRFKTLMIGLGCYACGCLLLTTTSLPHSLENGAGIPGLAISLVFIALASGSVKATVAPLIADQYDRERHQLLQQNDGTAVIVDGDRTLQFMYNAYYWFTNIASLGIIAVTFLERTIGFWAAYLLPTTLLTVPLLVLLCFYRKTTIIPPKGTVLINALHIILCAARSDFKLSHTTQEYQMRHNGREVPWDNYLIADVRQALAACKVLLSLVVFYLCVNEIFNNLISQSSQMQLHGVPNDLIQIFSPIACIILGPIIHYMLGFLAKNKISYGPMARITTAFIFCGMAMAYAAGVQQIIYSAAPCYDKPLVCPKSNRGTIANEVSVWIQIPVYFLLGIAEILGFVTVYEYSYKQAPQNMKSIVQAIGQLAACVASGLGTAISPVAKDPNLVVMYSCVSGAAALSGLMFWLYFGKQGRRAPPAWHGPRMQRTDDSS
ncbi:major facilitator superfamily domain-containing protein [Biscogniauxia marginata]|nr:major facilitator superfamily domain-containing protein [Biscogniauxia marginata]